MPHWCSLKWFNIKQMSDFFCFLINRINLSWVRIVHWQSLRIRFSSLPFFKLHRRQSVKQHKKAYIILTFARYFVIILLANMLAIVWGGAEQNANSINMLSFFVYMNQLLLMLMFMRRQRNQIINLLYKNHWWRIFCNYCKQPHCCAARMPSNLYR